MRWTHGIRARLRLLLRGAAEERMEQEMRFHLEMEMERYVREGMTPEDARRRAVLSFGGVEGHKEAMREGWTLAWVNGLSLDLKLGVRMLAKYPGLSVVGVLGMAAAIAIGAGYFTFIAAVTDPALPLHEGGRIVAIRNLDVAAGQARGIQPHDLHAWREELRAVEHLGAYRRVHRNVVTPDGRAEPFRVAEMNASGFHVARVPPLLGRYLIEEDEREGAPPVVVIGHDVWRTRFAGDPHVIGKTAQLGTSTHTVVGVMPRGFAFPVDDALWIPLNADAPDHEWGEAPPVEVFGRLSPGATLEQAQAQLTTLGERIASAHPETHRHLRPRVLPYTRAFLDGPEHAWALYLVQLLVTMLLVVIAVNVAILVYARTVTREGEIAVRLALGASRARVVTQLFGEALVLALAAAAVGLLIAWFALRQVNAYAARASGEFPFWWEVGLSPSTVLYVTGLTVLAAVIVGVVPGLKVTGRGLQPGLRELTGGTGIRLGRTWTALIVAQVAVAVAVLPATAAFAWSEVFPDGVTAPDFPTEGLVAAELDLQRESPTGSVADRQEFAGRLADRQVELVSRLEAEPWVAGVTSTSSVTSGTIALEPARPATEPTVLGVRFLQMDPAFFEVFGADFVMGRPFPSGDVAGSATAVVVNRSFARQYLGGGDPLGRRFRYTSTRGDIRPGGVERGDWYEIVGVVNDLPAELPYRWQGVPTLYHPVTMERPTPVTLVVRTRGTPPESVARRLREITTAGDPTLLLDEVRTLTARKREEERTRRQISFAMVAGALSVVLLSAAGIHALMAFTVARRRKEIGIRTALGAHPRRILTSVFARAAGQLSAGVAAGITVGGAVMLAGEYPTTRAIALLLAVAALMLSVGLLAALEPARRTLRIQPMEALRQD